MAASILLVTPHLGFGQLIKQKLEVVGGYSTVLVGSMSGAVERARIVNFSLAVLDNGFTDGSVLELGASLIRLNSNIRLIVILHKNMQSSAFFADMVVDDYLVLPFSPRELLDSVNDVLGRERGKISRTSASGHTALTSSAIEYGQKSIPKSGSDADFQSSPPLWMEDINKAAQHLARLSLSSASQAALILREKQLWAYAGQLSKEAVEELAGVVLHYWERDNSAVLESSGGKGSDLARFVRLKQTGHEYMLYATSLGQGMVLSLVYDTETSFHKIRTQANELARALTSSNEVELDSDFISDNNLFHEHASEHGRSAMADETRFSPQSSQLDPPLKLDDVPPHTPPGYRGPIPKPGEMQWIWEIEEDVELEQVGSPGTPDEDQPISASANDQEQPKGTKTERSLEDGVPIETQERQMGISVIENLYPNEASDFEAGNVRTELFLDFDSAAMYRLNYVCVLMPRFPNHHLLGDVSVHLEEWMRCLALAFGWRLEYLAIRPNYMHWVAGVTPRTSASRLVRLIRQHTSQRIFDEFPRLAEENPSGDFWAPGYLVVTSLKPLPGKLVMDFIRKTRQQQGTSGEIK